MTFRFRNFSVSKLFYIFGGFGFGIEKIKYRKKYRIRHRKNLVSEKVSDSVSEKVLVLVLEVGTQRPPTLLVSDISHSQQGYRMVSPPPDNQS